MSAGHIWGKYKREANGEDKPFEWTDELVLKFARFTNCESPDFQGRYADLEQFKQEQLKSKRDWEIVEWGEPPYIIEGRSIKSVRRLSDGEVFELHKTRVVDLNTKHEWVISEINVGKDGRLFFNGVNITHAQKVVKPNLFTKQDIIEFLSKNL